MPKNQVYVNKHTDDVLGKVAAAKESTKSAVLNTLIEQVGVGRDDVKSVVLLIPTDLLTGDREGLHDWLSARAVGILRKFYPED